MKKKDIYWWVLSWIWYCPYLVRLIFWRLLYVYNRKKWPDGDFTLELYKSYAK